MDKIYNLLLLITGSFLGVTLSMFLLAVKSIKNKANLILGIYLFLISMYFIQGTIYRVGWLERLPHIVHLQLFYETLAGPMIYFYVRTCTAKNFQMKPVLWLHFLVSGLLLLSQIPLFLQSGEEKAAFYYDFFLANKIAIKPWLVLTKSALALVYFALSFRLIQQYKKHLTEESSSIDRAFHRWLMLFASMALFPVLMIILWITLGGSTLLTSLALTMLFTLICSVYMIVLLKPEIFHTFPNQRVELEKEEVQRQKYENSNLQEEQKKRFVEKLLTYVEAEKPYKEGELTLSDLAGKVDIPPHYLSQVVNEKMNCSFLDFVNKYRVKEAKQMLKDAAYAHYTIIAVAYEAGFNSKTAFYSAFKKHTGMTPSAFRKG